VKPIDLLAEDGGLKSENEQKKETLDLLNI